MDAQRQGLRGEDDLDEAALEEVFHKLLEVGEETGVVHRQSPPKRFAIEQIAVQLGFVGVSDLVEASVHGRVDLGLLGITRQVEAVHGAACQRLAAAAPRKDEGDSREELPPPEPLYDGEQVGLRRAAALRRAATRR